MKRIPKTTCPWRDLRTATTAKRYRRRTYERHHQRPHGRRRMKVLVVDIGGTKVKVLASGQTEPRKAQSGKGLTPGRMIEIVRELEQDWEYEAISIGYPGLVGPAGPVSEPGNLGPGWV